MNVRRLHRAAAGAAVLVFVVSGVAFADGIVADSDALSVGVQTSLDLGVVLPGSVHDVQVPIALACSGWSHETAGDTIEVDVLGTNAPAGGALSAIGTSIGPVPNTWPASGSSCGGTQPLAAATPGAVTITAPATAGKHTGYTVVYDAASMANGFASASFSLTVDTPPSLVLPVSPVTIEGNTTGGAFAAYTVSATDAEDGTPPSPVCAPAVGAFVPLGPTTVSCSVTDSTGMTANGTFELDVVDTTPPVLAGLPGAIAVTTSNPAGVAVTYAAPTATDVVDPAAFVGCSPASGSVFAVGTTTVTCTATDASGNTSSGTFDATVTLVSAITPSAEWIPPVGSGVVEIRSGRTLPVKVTLAEGGQAVSTGDVELTLTPLATCPANPGDAATTPAAGPTVVAGPLSWQQGANRWSMLLRADAVPGAAGSCTRADVSVNGVTAGFFVLEIVR